MLNVIATDNPEVVAPDLLDDPQLAAYIGVEERTLRDWRNSRGLPYIKLTAKVIRYRRSDVNAWLAQHRVASR